MRGLAKDFADLEIEHDVLTTERDGQVRKSAKLEDENAALVSANSKLKDENAGLKKNKAGHKKVFNKLTGEVGDLKKELESEKAAHADTVHHKQETVAMYTDAKREGAEFSRKLEASEKRVQLLVPEIGGVAAVLHEMETRMGYKAPHGDDLVKRAEDALEKILERGGLVKTAEAVLAAAVEAAAKKKR